MNSPFPVTSATITERATGLAERIAAENVPPAAVVMPNGTPPSAPGCFAIQRVSGLPSPSTSSVCVVAAREGRLALVAVHPPAGADGADAVVRAPGDDD